METEPIVEISDLSVLPASPLVSVSMLAYQHEKFIARAIEGVIAQECNFPIELIISEDCSPDRTREITLDYQRRYPALIRILVSEHNVGMHANAARCLAACRGRFVAICEGDDYWHDPGKLQMQVEELQLSPSAQLVHTDYNRRAGNRVLRNAHRRLKTAHLAKGDAFASLLHSMTVVTPTAMYRKQLLTDLDASGILSPEWPFGDYPTALYAALKGPVVYVPVSTATYRIAQGSATNRGRSRFLKMRIAGAECRELFMSLRRLPDSVERGVRVHMHRDLMRHAVLGGAGERYELEHEWLVSNCVPPPRLGHFIASVLIRSRFLLRLFRVALNTSQKLTWLARSSRIKPIGRPEL